MSKIAIYPGSFDPPTNGHVYIARRGVEVFDKLVVAIARNVHKTPLFDESERLEMLREVLGTDPRIEADAFDGLLVDYAKRKGATVILRGLRAVADFEYEFQMANMNRKLAPGIETLFMMTGEAHFYVSAQIVREVAMLGGSVSGLVPPLVEDRLKKKLGGRGD